MPRIAIQLKGAGVVVLAVALAGCGSSSPLGTGIPTVGASPGATTSSSEGADPQIEAPTPDLPDSAQATFLAAANTELDLQRQIRDEIYTAEVMGAEGTQVVTDIEDAEKAFGEGALADFVEQTGVDLSASSRESQPMAIVGGRLLNEWSGSLFGYTSFMTSTWLGFAPQMLHNLAGRATFESQTIEKTETHDSTIGNLKEHLTLTEKVTVGAGQGRIVFDVTLTSTADMADAATGAPVAHRVSNDTGHFEVNACPDAQGVGEGKYTLVDKQEVSNAAGVSNGGTTSTDATFRVLDGDDAHLVNTEVDANVDSAAHGTKPGAGGATGEPFNWDTSATYNLTVPASGSTTYDGVTNLASSDGTTTHLGDLGWLIAIASGYLAEAARQAEKFWRSGECIELKTNEESRTVQADEEITLTVDSDHKWDKQPVTAPIKAAFSGAASLSPTDTDQPPPASFNFIAGPNQGDKGTIDLSQTGRRGIGKKTVEFTVGDSNFGGTVNYEATAEFLNATTTYKITLEVVLLVDESSQKLTSDPDGGSTYSYDFDTTGGNKNGGSDCSDCPVEPPCSSHGEGALQDPAQFEQGTTNGVLSVLGALGDDVLHLKVAIPISCGGGNQTYFTVACGDPDGLKAEFDGDASYQISSTCHSDLSRPGFVNTADGHVEGTLSPLDGPTSPEP